MAQPLFDAGLNGLSDSKWSGVKGSAYRVVGVDFRSEPGVLKAHQALEKASGTTVTELCKVALAVSDGSTLWFSSESGNIWREVSGTYTLVHTTVPLAGGAACLDAKEYDGDIYWSTEKYVHKIPVASIGGTWGDLMWQNFGAFKNGDDTYHPMEVQNLQLFIGDKYDIAKVDNPNDDPGTGEKTLSVTFSTAVRSVSGDCFVYSSTGDRYPEYRLSERATSASTSSLTKSMSISAGTDRLLVVCVWSWRVGSTTLTHPTGVTFDGVSLTSKYSGGPAMGSDRVALDVYYMVNPPVKSANIVASWGAAQPNVVMHAFLFNNASSISNVDSTAVTTAATTNSKTGTTTTEYATRLFSVVSESATHTPNAAQMEIHASAGNTYGSDSSSILGVTSGGFQDTTDFKVKKPERITTLHPFDIDLLVGTKVADTVNKARVLRWDTVNSGWSADDDVDENGINAFIRDDNFVYVQAGDYGRIYFYNGEKLEPFKRIPGDWSPTKTARVYSRSVAFHLGIPIFGVSNVAGNPVLQGVYGLGSYSAGYPKVLSLDFPLPQTSDATIGAILTRGADLYAAWKSGTNVGVCKLNWSAKYTGSYIETRMLTPLKARSDHSTASRFFADYVSLPTSTGITLGVKTKHDTNYTSLTVVNDTDRMQVRADRSTPKIANMQLRIGFTVNGNNSPIIENIAYE